MRTVTSCRSSPDNLAQLLNVSLHRLHQCLPPLLELCRLFAGLFVRRLSCQRLHLWELGESDSPILNAQIGKSFKIPIGCQDRELMLSRKGRQHYVYLR